MFLSTKKPLVLERLFKKSQVELPSQEREVIPPQALNLIL